MPGDVLKSLMQHEALAIERRAREGRSSTSPCVFRKVGLIMAGLIVRTGKGAENADLKAMGDGVMNPHEKR